MNPYLAALLGGGVGVGVFIILRSFTRNRTIALTDLNAVLTSTGTSVATLNSHDPTSLVGDELTDGQARLGRFGVKILSSIGLSDVAKLNDQLRILHKSVERHAYEKVLGAVAGFTLPIVFGAALVAGGITVPVVVLLMVSVFAALAGFFYPDIPLTEKVEDRRRGFRHALSSYLDLVTILLAGGAGTESALEGAADAGDGWAFAEIRQTLRRARLTRRSPWEVLEELGIELGVPELQELASSVALAGGQGAKVKSSLSAKADAMRAHQAAELEGSAESQTEKMIIPVVVLIVGLVLFIGYGALEAITADPTQQITDVGEEVVVDN